MNLTTLQSQWQDTPEYHKGVHEHFIELVNANPLLKEHRDWCETNFHGLGERSFGQLWLLICQELPENPIMCEIGVFRGQIVSLWRLLRKDANILGVTPMDSSGGVWESDYPSDIKNIHEHFNLEQPVLYKGYSQEELAISLAKDWSGYNFGGGIDCLYIDGSHEYIDVMDDFINYAPMVKRGGFLVIDDACCDMKMPWGYFQGIQEVTDASLAYIKSEEWEFITNCVHLRVYRKL